MEANDMEKLREIIKEELKALTSSNKDTNCINQGIQYKTPQTSQNITNYQGSNSRSNYRYCYYCKDPSHIKRNCPKLVALTKQWEQNQKNVQIPQVTNANGSQIQGQSHTTQNATENSKQDLKC